MRDRREIQIRGPRQVRMVRQGEGHRLRRGLLRPVLRRAAMPERLAASHRAESRPTRSRQQAVGCARGEPGGEVTTTRLRHPFGAGVSSTTSNAGGGIPVLTVKEAAVKATVSVALVYLWL